MIYLIFQVFHHLSDLFVVVLHDLKLKKLIKLFTYFQFVALRDIVTLQNPSPDYNCIVIVNINYGSKFLGKDLESLGRGKRAINKRKGQEEKTKYTHKKTRTTKTFGWSQQENPSPDLVWCEPDVIIILQLQLRASRWRQSDKNKVIFSPPHPLSPAGNYTSMCFPVSCAESRRAACVFLSFSTLWRFHTQGWRIHLGLSEGGHEQVRASSFYLPDVSEVLGVNSLNLKL